MAESTKAPRRGGMTLDDGVALVQRPYCRADRWRRSARSAKPRALLNYNRASSRPKSRHELPLCRSRGCSRRMRRLHDVAEQAWGQAAATARTSRPESTSSRPEPACSITTGVAARVHTHPSRDSPEGFTAVETRSSRTCTKADRQVLRELIDAAGSLTGGGAEIVAERSAGNLPRQVHHRRYLISPNAHGRVAPSAELYGHSRRWRTRRYMMPAGRCRPRRAASRRSSRSRFTRQKQVRKLTRRARHSSAARGRAAHVADTFANQAF